MFALDLRQHHRDGLRVLVLQIVGEHGLVHIGQLVPHGPSRGPADLLHQRVDLVGRHEGVEQALGLLERTHDRARPRQARDELDEQGLDDARADRAERGHRLGDLLDLLLVQLSPDFLVVLSQREQDHGRLLRPGEALGVVDRLLLAGGYAHQDSCSQLRRMEIDSSGCRSTNSATLRTDEAFT